VFDAPMRVNKDSGSRAGSPCRVRRVKDADRSLAGADRRRRAVEIRRRLLPFRVIAYIDIALEVRLAVEVERIPQIVECRHVGRHVKIALLHFWVRKIVAAAVRDWLKQI
jgi:hypothetical protein